MNRNKRKSEGVHFSLKVNKRFKSYEESAVSEHDPTIISPKETAFNSRLKTWILDNPHNERDISAYMESKRKVVKNILLNKLECQKIKVTFELSLSFKEANEDAIPEITRVQIENKVFSISKKFDIFYNDVMHKIKEDVNIVLSKASSWSLEQLEIQINRYSQCASESKYLSNVTKENPALIRVNNNDDKSFQWAVLSALHPVKRNVENISNYEPFANELCFNGITFPVTLDDIEKIEKQNENLSINVYGISDDRCVYPKWITKNTKANHVDLLHSEEPNHYAWIKNLPLFVSKQLRKKPAKNACKRCLTLIYDEKDLNQHNDLCQKHEPFAVKMPQDNEKFLCFEHDTYALRVPFVCYADFECLTAKTEDCLSSSSKTFANSYQKHQPVSFSYYITYDGDFYKPPVVYRDLDAPEKFIEMLTAEAKEISEIYQRVQQTIHLSAEEEISYNKAEECYLCGKMFAQNDPKVIEYSLLTNKYRGPVHESCNIKSDPPKFLPVFLHGFSNYDSHIFVRELALGEASKSVLAENEERFISLSKHVKWNMELRFLDSLRFLTGSLDSLAGYLEKSQFKHISNHFEEDKIDLVRKKGVYPYDYLDNIQKWEETVLPPIKDFYNNLDERDITDEEYAHAQNVWKAFQIHSLGEYSDLYVKTDVLLLADIFENFRNICLKTYALDPAWYFSAAGLSWDAMLKLTKVNLELFTDYNMLMFAEKGIRGGVAYCSKRYSEANNRYMLEYDHSKDSQYIMHLDVNNLYGWAMSQPLPLRNFRWCENVDVMEIADDSPIGYILEVDLEYPESLHDLHSDFPLAPEKRVHDDSLGEMLLTTLYDKNKYILHYRNLKQYLKLGLILKKTHRVLQFNQSAWLKPYIELNTKKRTTAKNEFEKNFYKLMNNCIYGKTMENIRKRRTDIKLCSSGKDVENFVAKTHFESRTIFDKNLAAIRMKKTKLVFNKPMIIGMAVLDISKLYMYDFHYRKMKEQYGSNVQLLYTHTDSLIYEVKTDDFYEDMKNSSELYDTSNYPDDNAFHILPMNKKRLGLMKDENGGKIITSFVGLKSMVYAYQIDAASTVKKAAGIKRQAIEKKTTFEDYKSCLFEQKTKTLTYNEIRSIRHNIYSVTVTKVALSFKDKKRHILDDGIETLALGHYKIRS